MPPFRRPSGPAAAGDPIPFTADGTYHLFYLSSPAGTLDYPERVRTSWQHSATTDFRTWTALPPALEPGPPKSIDAGGIWTGSVVEHGGTYWLFYTGHSPEAANPQTICLATSTDLVSFRRHPGNPVLTPTDSFEPVDWRDPYVFYNEEEQCWWMLIAARAATGPYWRRGVIVLATSPDLLTWTVQEEPLYSPGDTYCPECPELWRAGDRWYLVYSRFSENAGTIYRVGDTPRGPFRTPADDRLGGRRWYAAKSAPHPRRPGRVFLGWIHDQAGIDPARRWLWGGDFALPRLVVPADDGRLLIEPILDDAADQATTLETSLGAAGGSDEATLLDQLPDRVRLDVQVSTREAATCRLDLVDGTDRGWSLQWHRATGHVELRVTPEPLDDFWADLTHRHDSRGVDGPVVAESRIPGSADELGFSLVLDGDLLEVFVAGGVPLTHRITRLPEQRLLFAVLDGSATLRMRRISS